MNVGIIGGGPAGATLASLLVLRGLRPVLFSDDKTPDLIVGESLIPAVVPILRTLGIEDRVAAISQYKPGVSFMHAKADDIDFTFQPVQGVLPTYAYNTPRPAFDQLLAQRAQELGVHKVSKRATLIKLGEDRVGLSEETLAEVPAWQGQQPGLLVDASGRRRAFARLLEIPAKEGPRKDQAYFAHYRGCTHPKEDGQVIITQLEVGWSWRIPLPDAILSIGVVLHRDEAQRLGSTPAERLQAAIDRDPQLAKATVSAKRISDVKSYNNYQLISERGHGAGWVTLGDAYGFLDPMLSPGLFMALESAQLLANALVDDKGRVAHHLGNRFARYFKEFDGWLDAWWELIEYFYDGRIFSLYECGTKICEKYEYSSITKVIQKHVEHNLACMASGAWTRRRYSRGMLGFMSKHMIRGVTPPEELAIC